MGLPIVKMGLMKLTVSLVDHVDTTCPYCMTGVHSVLCVTSCALFIINRGDYVSYLPHHNGLKQPNIQFDGFFFRSKVQFHWTPAFQKVQVQSNAETLWKRLALEGYQHWAAWSLYIWNRCPKKTCALDDISIWDESFAWIWNASASNWCNWFFSSFDSFVLTEGENHLEGLA